jgi:hypothetical protein
LQLIARNHLTKVDMPVEHVHPVIELAHVRQILVLAGRVHAVNLFDLYFQAFFCNWLLLQLSEDGFHFKGLDQP